MITNDQFIERLRRLLRAATAEPHDLRSEALRDGFLSWMKRFDSVIDSTTVRCVCDDRDGRLVRHISLIFPPTRPPGAGMVEALIAEFEIEPRTANMRIDSSPGGCMIQFNTVLSPPAGIDPTETATH